MAMLQDESVNLALPSALQRLLKHWRALDEALPAGQPK
jgi:hypothetical protein